MTGTGGRAWAAWAIAALVLAGGAARAEAGPSPASKASDARRSLRRSIAFRSFAANVIVPQSRSFRMPREAAPATPPARVAVAITHVAAGIVILEQAATTTLDISLRNTTASRQEAELVVPVPDGAVVRGFTFQGAAKEPTARLLPKEEARRLYDSIVAKVRDPALLDFHDVSTALGGRFQVIDGLAAGLTYTHLFYFSRNTTGKSGNADLHETSKGPDAGGIYKQTIGVFNVSLHGSFDPFVDEPELEPELEPAEMAAR